MRTLPVVAVLAALAQPAGAEVYPDLTFGQGAAKTLDATVTLYFPDGRPSRCDSNYTDDDVTLTLNPCKLGWECIYALRHAFSTLGSSKPGLASSGAVRLAGPMMLGNYAFEVQCEAELSAAGDLVSSARIIPMTPIDVQD